MTKKKKKNRLQTWNSVEINYPEKRMVDGEVTIVRRTGLKHRDVLIRTPCNGEC